MIPLIFTAIFASYEDIKKREVSNELLIIGLIIGIIVAIYNKCFISALTGSIIMAAPLYILAYTFMIFTGKQGIGGGDVKIAFVYGMYLRHLKFIYAAFFITFILAGAFFLITKLKKRKTDNSGIPLIPFMSIGTIIIYIIENIV